MQCLALGEKRSARRLAADVPSNTSISADASTTINARLSPREQPSRAKASGAPRHDV